MYSKTHGRLPSYGVQFKVSLQTSFPSISQPQLTWKIFGLYTFSMCQHLLTAYTLILKHRYIKSHQLKYTSLDILQTSFLILATVWRGLLSDIARFVFLLERQTVSCDFNALITSNKFTNMDVGIYKDYSGWLLVYLQVGVWIFGTPVPFISRYEGIDPWFVIFQELGLNQNGWFLWSLTLFMSAYHDICLIQRDVLPSCLWVLHLYCQEKHTWHLF